MKKSALEFIYEICESSGATHKVGHDFYYNFMNLNDEDMTFYIKAIILSRTEEQNKISFDEAKGVEALSIFSPVTQSDGDESYKPFTKWIGYIATGMVGINEDGGLAFFKPIGEPPTRKQKTKIKEKINNTKPLITKVIIECLEKYNVDEKHEDYPQQTEIKFDL